jgi:transposase
MLCRKQVPRLRLVIVNPETGGEVMEEITTVGIDLAKDVFAICVLDARGAVVERKVLRRAAFERWAEALLSLSGPCVVAMEACGSAHHWGRVFAARGHTARLMAAEFVVPLRQGGKNDGNDALAIAIAARQPTTRLVPVKTVEQQAILAWHRMRRGWIDERTALLNRVRGLLAEFGLVPGRSPAVLIAAMARIVDEPAAPEPMRAIVQQAREQLAQLDARLAACDMQIQAHARHAPQADRIRALLGMGPINAKPWWPRCPMPPCSVTAACSAPGWGSHHASTAPAARRGWGRARNGGMPTCVVCWSTARARRCRRRCGPYLTRRRGCGC